MFETLDVGEPFWLDLVQAAQIPGERVRLGFDRLTAEIFEEIVVGVHAVERRQRRVHLMEVPKHVVDEVRQRFGRDHSDPPMVQ